MVLHALSAVAFSPLTPSRSHAAACCPCSCRVASASAAAGVLGATALLTGVYYATPKETKDRIKRSMKRSGEG